MPRRWAETGHSRLRTRSLCLRIAAAATIAMLGGCATWPGHGVTPDAGGRVRIAVLPVSDRAEIAKLGDIVTLSAPPPADASQQIAQRMATVTDGITTAIERQLAASPYFEVVDHATVLKALGSGDDALTPERLRQLQSSLGVQAVLVVELSGYGRLKRKWVFYLIGSGVIEGAVQGVAVGKVTGSTAAGLAVWAEEILQESLTWGGGAYLFNRRFAPVILEGELTSTADGKAIWSDTAFTSLDTKALKRRPRVERDRKEVQLEVTTDKATRELVKDLLKTAKKEERVAGAP